jgi:methylated-DNA-[protein]-cysteine S-methyltransferase
MATPLFFTETQSPLGLITLTATERGISGLDFAEQKHWPADSDTWQKNDGPRFDSARAWLSSYFDRQPPAALPEIDLQTGTAFHKLVWEALKNIPSGQTRTYAQISEQIGHPNAVRAVGAAIGRNPLSLIVPCHRVIGSSGLLTGYAGGVDRKRWLLEHEGALQPSAPESGSV